MYNSVPFFLFPSHKKLESIDSFLQTTNFCWNLNSLVSENGGRDLNVIKNQGFCSYQNMNNQYQSVDHNLKLSTMCVRAQSYPMLCRSLDCSLQGFSVRRIFQARRLEWVAISLSRESSLTQGLNPCLLHLLLCRQILYQLSHRRSSKLFTKRYQLPQI